MSEIIKDISVQLFRCFSTNLRLRKFETLASTSILVARARVEFRILRLTKDSKSKIL